MKEENRVADLALEAAAEAVKKALAIRGAVAGDPEVIAESVVAAYLDSLLGGLPEEAVEAGREAVAARTDLIAPGDEPRTGWSHELAVDAALAFLRSLRGGVDAS